MACLWVDDIRPPPDETWVWARTSEAAKGCLATQPFDECSLDHDLGLYNIEELPADPDELLDLLQAARIKELHDQVETGLDLVHWMVDTGNVPPKTTIHSWNSDGTAAMAAWLNYHGYDCYIEPFAEPPRKEN